MTTNIPKSVESTMKRLSRFDFFGLPERSRVPSKFEVLSHVVVDDGATRWHVLSRTVSAGVDYTNRNNFLSHHLAISDSELGSNRSVFDLLGCSENFLNQWDGEPKLVDTRPISTLKGVSKRGKDWGVTVAGGNGLDQWIQWVEMGQAPLFLLDDAASDLFDLLAMAGKKLGPNRANSISFISVLGADIQGVKFDWIGLLRDTSIATAVASHSQRIIDTNRKVEPVPKSVPSTKQVTVGDGVGGHGAASPSQKASPPSDDFFDSFVSPVKASPSNSKKTSTSSGKSPAVSSPASIPPPPPSPSSSTPFFAAIAGVAVLGLLTIVFLFLWLNTRSSLENEIANQLTQLNDQEKQLQAEKKRLSELTNNKNAELQLAEKKLGEYRAQAEEANGLKQEVITLRADNVRLNKQLKDISTAPPSIDEKKDVTSPGEGGKEVVLGEFSACIDVAQMPTKKPVSIVLPMFGELKLKKASMLVEFGRSASLLVEDGRKFRTATEGAYLAGELGRIEGPPKEAAKSKLDLFIGPDSNSGEEIKEFQIACKRTPVRLEISNDKGEVFVVHLVFQPRQPSLRYISVGKSYSEGSDEIWGAFMRDLNMYPSEMLLNNTKPSISPAGFQLAKLRFTVPSQWPFGERLVAVPGVVSIEPIKISESNKGSTLGAEVLVSDFWLPVSVQLYPKEDKTFLGFHFNHSRASKSSKSIPIEQLKKSAEEAARLSCCLQCLDADGVAFQLICFDQEDVELESHLSLVGEEVKPFDASNQ